MGTVADSLFAALMSWVRALVNDFWAIFSSERMTILEFLGKNWIAIVLLLLAVGLVMDWLIWLVRWQPYHLWAQRIRRILRIQTPEDEETAGLRASAARMPDRPQSAPEPARQDWFPPERAVLREEDELRAMAQAESVPDASLRAYPGMRYDGNRPAAPRPASTDTQRYAAVHSEGPGAAEVARRRGEIDAWQRQMQEEARAKAEAQQAQLLRQAQEAERERRAREAQEAERARQAEQARLAQEAERARQAEQARLAQEAERARQAEQARLAQEAERARQAEQARLAQEAERARQAEQARLAQEKYQRELAEYEQKKVQYERELAEYQRQKAAYDAQMASLAQQQNPAQENAESAARRKRAAQSAQPQSFTADAVAANTDARKSGGLMGRVVKAMQMIEPEESEINGINALPPRVDRHEAYGPAKRPQREQKRRR